MRELLQTNAVSIVLHLVVGALLAFAAPAALSVVKDAEPIAFEVIDVPAPMAAEPVPEPEPEPSEAPPDQPRQEKMARQVETPRPFQQRPEPGPETPPEDVDSLATPSAPVPVLHMEAIVGSGAAGEYTSTAGAGLPVPADQGGQGGSGARGEVGPLAGQKGLGLDVSAEWEVSRYPEPTNASRFEPDYPPLARREEREADVVVALWIDEAGRVVDTEVVEPAGHGFDEAAVRYVTRLRFTPAMAGNRAVATRIEWAVEFRAKN